MKDSHEPQPDGTGAIDASEVAGGAEALDDEWVPFPGGELLGEPPPLLCAACRNRAPDDAEWSVLKGTICFGCYRGNLERRRRLRAAVEVASASETGFHFRRPFEPVDSARLERLRVARATARAADATGLCRLERRRRQAQIAARRALERDAREPSGQHLQPTRVVRATTVVNVEDLRMPTAWLPFLMSR